MLTIDSASGIIEIPKVDSYEILMNSIKEILNINDELFQYLYFSYIDQEEKERIRLIPQIYDDFINQEFPKVSIGFLDNINDKIIEQFMEIINRNKKRFQKGKESIIKLDDENSEKNEENDENDENDEYILKNRDKIDIKNFEPLNSEIDFKKKNVEEKNINEISDNSEKNLKKYNEDLQNLDTENKEKKDINDFDEFGDNIKNIINSNCNLIKNDILSSVINGISKIENKSSIKNKNQIIHEGTKCSLCGQSPIIGIMYKCIECDDFNICEICEDSQKHPHPFYKIRNKI